MAEQQELIATAETLLECTLHPKIRALVEYWLSIHPGGPRLPGRQHFDPVDIPGLLANIWLVDVERTPDIRLRYRLLGTSVARAFDSDLTGTYLENVHPDVTTGKVEIYLHKVLEAGLPAWRTGRPTLWQLKDFLNLERIYLPMASNGEDIDLVLAMTIFVNRFGEEF